MGGWMLLTLVLLADAQINKYLERQNWVPNDMHIVKIKILMLKVDGAVFPRKLILVLCMY